ncbi:MAG: hypothetical protein XD48_1032, partial [Archaeoglobus fulgidus]
LLVGFVLVVEVAAFATLLMLGRT